MVPAVRTTPGRTSLTANAKSIRDQMEYELLDTANPHISTVYGALVGYLLSGSLR